MSGKFDLSDISKVCAVSQSLIQVEILDCQEFKNKLENRLALGSYLQIADDNASVIAIVKAYRIKDNVIRKGDAETIEPSFILDAEPIGFLKGGQFQRGVQRITIPPKSVYLADTDTLKSIYSGDAFDAPMSLGSLSQDENVRVPIDGDIFFGKHIAIVGSTGSGKSCTVVKVLREGINASCEQGKKRLLNNSHIVVFDLHGEYKAAFPEANSLNVGNMKMPYWLMNAEELEEMFILSNELNSHNQISQFRHAVLENKKKHNSGSSKISYDTPVYFSMEEVYHYIVNMNSEIINKKQEEQHIPKLADGTLIKTREEKYFDKILDFAPQSSAKDTKASNGPFYGSFERFILRIRNILDKTRLEFLFDTKKGDGSPYETSDVKELMESLVGYSEKNKRNITIVELDGIPFEVQSLAVSLISRIIFDLGYHLKKTGRSQTDEIPFLVVYEEAHKYAPNSQLARYQSVTKSIERIAKEGRKYGISLMVVSQRPSEISETIFSQCNSFIAMRLTNPSDQNYVRRLLPDSVVAITETLPNLEQREALILGESIKIPTIIKVDVIENKPDSQDIDVFQEWQKDWVDVPFVEIIENMKKL